jgi:predicted nucleic acid-binding protein
MDFVIDASFAAPLCLAEAESATTSDFFDRIAATDRLRVPSLWWYEMSNLLTAAVRCGRLGEGDAISAFELLRQLDILTDPRTGSELAMDIFGIARFHGLTAYDAAYLEMAARTGSTLCSYDEELRTAARRAELQLVPEWTGP